MEIEIEIEISELELETKRDREIRERENARWKLILRCAKQILTQNDKKKHRKRDSNTRLAQQIASKTNLFDSIYRL